jgi:hypothetical protein
MIRHKTRDAKDRPSARPANSLHALILVGPTHRAKPPEIMPVVSRPSRLAFLEDFTREHSLSGLHATSAEIAGAF